MRGLYCIVLLYQNEKRRPHFCHLCRLHVRQRGWWLACSRFTVCPMIFSLDSLHTRRLISTTFSLFCWSPARLLCRFNLLKKNNHFLLVLCHKRPLSFDTTRAFQTQICTQTEGCKNINIFRSYCKAQLVVNWKFSLNREKKRSKGWITNDIRSLSTIEKMM